MVFLLGAVSSHKLVVSFCLGAELVGGGVPLIPHLVAVLVFSLGSAAGVGLGMALYGLPVAGAGAEATLTDWPLLPVLQAAAAGTLLYVTLAEVLPRERARSQNNFPRRLLQLVSFTVGVVLITVLVLFLGESWALHYNTGGHAYCGHVPRMCVSDEYICLPLVPDAHHDPVQKTLGPG